MMNRTGTVNHIGASGTKPATYNGAHMTKTEQITNAIRNHIQTGKYPPGETLPPYSELAHHYNAGRETIARALKPLEAEGLIQPINGTGIRVRVRPPQRRLRRHTLISHDPRTGYRFPAASDGEKWIAHGTPHASWEIPPPRVAEVLGLGEGELALRRRRVMGPAGEEEPFSVTDTWLPRWVVDEVPAVGAADTGPGGFLRRLEEAGYGPLSWTQYARAGMPSVVEARLLGVSPRMPVVVLVRPGVSPSGVVVEVTVSVVASDRVELVSELVRGPSAVWPVETEVSGIG